MKKLYKLVIFTLVLTIFNTIFLSIPTSVANAEQDYTVKTISEIGNPTIAGTGSYYDDGMLYYANTGSTIGYNIDHSSTVFEFDIIFDALAWPAWFSLTLKAGGFDRTQSANLAQKGYSFAFFPSGAIEVWKTDLADSVTANIGAINTGVKYRFKIGAINQTDGVLLTLSVDGTEVISYLDTTDAFFSGEWFNICSDGGVTARLFSTKKEVYPNYYTYTLATMGEYPTIAGAASCKVDNYNNIDIYGAGATVGFGQQLRNFSLEMNFNFSTFEGGSNFWIAMRRQGYDRANNFSADGYAVRLGRMGAVDIYKNGSLLGSVGYGFTTDTDYIVEIGTVDLDKNRTNIFVNINNSIVISVMDESSPIQKGGWITMSGDGSVVCKITSTNNRLTPLVTKVRENTYNYVIETYFNNTISYTDMNYTDFTNTMLNAILVNDYSVYDVNNSYYGLDSANQVNAIDVEYIDNKLILTVSKSWYLKATNATDGEIDLQTLTIKKTSASTGLICPSGFILKQTYYYNF